MKRFNLSTRLLVQLAVLVALATVLKVTAITTGDWRIGVFGIPLVIIGLMYRPHVAILAGLIVDFLYATQMGYAPFTMFTLETVFFALIPSLYIFLFKDVFKLNINMIGIIISVIIAYGLGLYTNTLALMILYGYSLDRIMQVFPFRATISLANIVVVIIILEALFERVIKPRIEEMDLF